MNSLWLVGLSALWLGILTSISPCPLATNIAAISFIGRRVSSPRQVILSGLLYTFGRMVTYAVLGIFLVASMLSIPEIANFLQKYMNKILGPVLILVGMFLVELISFNLNGSMITQGVQRKVEKSGVWGAGLLGIIFALSFCPTSAALFFGSLVPLSLKHGSTLLLPSIYGIGTALPVILFAVLLVWSAQWVGKVFNKVTLIELWLRRITGSLFILIGCYFCLAYIFQVL